MPDIKRAVFLKLSGEKLSGSSLSSGCWDQQAINQTVNRIKKVHSNQKTLNVSGLTIVPGAGNIARGDKLRDQGILKSYSDVVGRTAIILNAIVLADALQLSGVPSQIFIAAKMSYSDPGIKTTPYTVEGLKKAHQAGKVAIIAGGTGDDNVTTDNAVVIYAADYKNAHKEEVLVLKSTKFDGVYDSDPKHNPSATKFKSIGAGYMLSDYSRYSVVDQASLNTLMDKQLSMRVYNEDEHDLSEVLDSQNIGTVILSSSQEPISY